MDGAVRALGRAVAKPPGAMKDNIPAREVLTPTQSNSGRIFFFLSSHFAECKIKTIPL